ncbi:MAG: leucine-rich repeat domain-containing protein [Lachnospiraceae bacterium]|nr:leucine-rich repeat domain-containing protein [Lachnospiraceae bacterium]
MKKLTTTILALLLTLSLAACGATDPVSVDIPSKFSELQDGVAQPTPSPKPSPSSPPSAPAKETVANVPTKPAAAAYHFDQLAEAAAGDFDYEPDQTTGGMMITKYNGSLTGLRLPATIEGQPVTAIGAGAFTNSVVEAMYVPESVVVIGVNAFRNCKAMTDIYFPDSLAAIEGVPFSTDVAVSYKGLVFKGNEVVSAVAMREYGYGLMEYGGRNWFVLEQAGDKALLLCVGIIEERTFNPGMMEITWEGSKTRQWLNEDFYNSISQEERERIADTLVVNQANPWYNIDGGNDTTDKIFLLSLAEVVKYFGDSGQLAEKPSGATQYIDDEHNKARIVYITGGAAWWWLRSPGDAGNRVAYVTRDGFIDIYGLGAGSNNRGVRPALWLSLQ